MSTEKQKQPLFHYIFSGWLMLVLTYAAELFSTCAHVLKEEEWCMQWVTIID
jgi:hypothetical protein